MKFNKVVNGVAVSEDISPADYDALLVAEREVAQEKREREQKAIDLERAALRAFLNDDTVLFEALKTQWKKL